MSIQFLTSGSRVQTERRSAAVQSAGTACASFQERLAQAASSASPVPQSGFHLYMGENMVFSGGRGGKNGTIQEVHAEYTADSTPEDPIVRIFGTSDRGPYEFTRHIRDIDPSCASYAELAALYGHLVKTGAIQGSAGPLPTGSDLYDVTEKRDYLSEIVRVQNDWRLGSTCKAEASELLGLYQGCASGSAQAGTASVFRTGLTKDELLSALYDAKRTMLERMKAGKEKQEEEDAWNELMEYIDAWIESLREGADIERSARAYADLQARRSERPVEVKTTSDYLLEKLEAYLAG